MACLGLLTLGLVVPDPLSQDGSVEVRDFVGPHYIEMLVGAEKPYIAGGHGGTDYTPFIASRLVMAGYSRFS